MPFVNQTRDPFELSDLFPKIEVFGKRPEPGIKDGDEAGPRVNVVTLSTMSKRSAANGGVPFVNGDVRSVQSVRVSGGTTRWTCSDDGYALA